MTDEHQVQNRMADEPQLELVRASSERPTWWTRRSRSLIGSLKSRTSITVVLSLSILLVIAVGFWFGI